jgi:hypothetical protein
MFELHLYWQVALVSVVVTVLPNKFSHFLFYLVGNFLVCVVLERIEIPSVSLIFLQSGGS